MSDIDNDRQGVALSDEYPEGFDASCGIPATHMKEANMVAASLIGERKWDVPCIAAAISRASSSQGVALPDESNGTGFSCAKRAADPSNEFAACGRWCENASTCPSTASHAPPGFDFKKFCRYVDILSDMSEEERDSSGSGVYPLSPELNTAVHAVNQTETRVRRRFNRYMNNPKGCFCGGTGCENCVASSSQAEMPDIKDMVDRFLGWKLPRDFSPDCGISFTPPANPECGPVGTNLLNADQARQMFEYVLAAAAAPKP